ncbi:sigma-70 family RNA polymerase sigma factor [Halobacillus trueperi]|uniref:RNA polymerase subunit sigma-24 n=1 Tax=Halobacillus trueperi TaxID=156205 RepID=A0A3E0J858_9BACI|nr:sigma-70 family RNA polymerase sigma factor [Halobacillus trueperi]REJ09135.1 RNA polymerase subunit sigma-24 [Halobacillus trueperi]
MEVSIIEKAINGDDESFLIMMKNYKTDIYKTALAFLKNEEDAREALQEVTARAYQKRHQLRKPLYVKTWLVRITIHYCQDLLTHKKRIHTREYVDPVQERRDETERIALEEAISSLQPKEQELVYLKYFHGITFRELSKIMNVKENTLKTRLYTALAKLKQELGEEEQHEQA